MAPLLLILIPIIAIFVVRSHFRTLDWRNNETLFKAAYKVDPDSVILRNFLANELLKKGKTKEAALLLGESRSKEIGIPQSFRERATLATQGIAALQQGDYVQAAVLPSRILIRDLVKDGKPLPRSQDIDFDAGWQGDPITVEHLTEVAKRWRLQSRDV